MRRGSTGVNRRWLRLTAIVAQREIRQRGRSRAFAVSTIVLLLVVAAGVAIPAILAHQLLLIYANANNGFSMPQMNMQAMNNPMLMNNPFMLNMNMMTLQQQINNPVVADINSMIQRSLFPIISLKIFVI